MFNGGTESPERFLGKRIQYLRRSKGLTQQGLCYKAHLSYSTLAKIERGAIKSPSVFTVQSIASALNLSIDQILENNQNISQNNSHQITRNLKTTKNNIRFVYFDINGCLVRFYQRAFVKIASDFALDLDKVESTFWNYNESVNKGKLSMAEFNQKFASKLGVNSIDWAKYYLSEVEPVPGTKELIEQVYKNYYIGLFSNTMPSLIKSLINIGKVPDIEYDSVIDSSEVKTVKPELKIFEIALNNIHLNPNEVLLVDDTRNNLIAAGKVGLHTLWFDYSRPKESIQEIKKVLEL